MYDVFQHQLNKIPFLKECDYSILLDPVRLKLAVIPNLILNDPMTRLYDGVKVYSLDEGLGVYKENNRYLWFEGGHCDMIYSIEDLDKVTTRHTFINRHKVDVRTGFGKKEYLWKGGHYFHINKKREWDILKYRNIMHGFDFKDNTCINNLISQLFEIKDQVCFDYVSYHIKSNTDLNLTRDLCAYDVLHQSLTSFLGTERYNYNPMTKMVKNQICSWFNLLFESNVTYSNPELFFTLFHAAWVLRRENNNWDDMLKILVKCKIPHKVLNNTYGYIVEIFNWEGDPLFHFNSDNIRCWYRNGTDEVNNFSWIHNILWRLCQTRPNETSELFVASEA
jgi:hypothetical protein